MSPMIPTELLHVIRPRRRHTDSEITVTTAFHRMFPILAHSAAHRRPAGYTFCSCFLFIFFTIPVGPITSKSTGPIVAKFSGLVERACNDLVAVL